MRSETKNYDVYSMRYKYFNPCRYRNSQKSLMQKSSAKILWYVLFWFNDLPSQQKGPIISSHVVLCRHYAILFFLKPGGASLGVVMGRLCLFRSVLTWSEKYSWVGLSRFEKVNSKVYHVSYRFWLVGRFFFLRINYIFDILIFNKNWN